ncbi:hypothetical protein QTP88_010132 [Uroleucon formosanum]
MYCKLIRKSLLDSIEKRFSNILSFNTVEADYAAIAAFSHPKFKNKWLNCIYTSYSRDKLLSIFKKAVTAESITTSEEIVEIEEDHSDFYDFGPAIQNDTTETSTSAEIEVRSVWKKKESKYGSQIVLPFFLFFDDYEIGYPLGSHSGIHKLGAVYISIPCIPSHRQSSLNTLFLALLFHSSDRVKFGNNIIFKPLIDEINYLRDTGIYINTDVFNGILTLELGVLVGDNLGIHSIAGFVESFSSNYPCRVCKLRKNEIKKLCYVDKKMLKTMEQYNLDVIKEDISNSGIKEACV